MGRFADRHGIVAPLICGALALGCGYVLSGFVANIWQFALAQALIGFGSSAAFGPLMSDMSLGRQELRLKPGPASPGSPGRSDGAGPRPPA